MSQVDFYILRESSPAARLKLACRLVERAYAQGERVLVRVDDEGELGELDQLLWTFADRAFVPHDRLPAGAAPADVDAPVALICGALPANAAQWPLLVDLALGQAPAKPLPARLIEIIDADETRRRQGRDRFRAYRDAGAPPNTIHWDNETSAANG
jgi:DNA polymerase-3 subunit chi